MSTKTKFLKIAVPLLVIIFGIVIMVALVSRRPAPNREIRNDPGILVEIFTAKKKSTNVTVKGTGTVEAAQEVSVIPQISGRVVYISPHLHVGGFFKTNDILFKIEDTDYKLALERAVAARTKAEYELATIESQARIARAEWERINKNSETPPNPLVVYEPQLKNAQASLASAEADVKKVELDLERTKIRAAFNSRVRSENIDIGQYVRTGTSVAVLSGTDTAEIVVPMPLDDLRWLSIPRSGDKIKGSQASVGLNVGGKWYNWQGHIVRSTGEVDPKSRMMQIVVEITDPYDLRGKSDTERPLLAVGTFIDIRIKGLMVKDVFVIPRTAFRDNATVWVMNSENKLNIKNVIPLRIEKQEVIITEGLSEGERVVLTNISGAADGMKLKPMKK
jgi:RND family efflux transporter MFP subunit